MKEKVKLLTEAAGFSSTYGAQEIERLGNLVLLVVEDCLRAVRETSTTHALTTYDLGQIEGTIERSIKSICDSYGLDMYKYKKDVNSFLDHRPPLRSRF